MAVRLTKLGDSYLKHKEDLVEAQVISQESKAEIRRDCHPFAKN
jgi:hypothetical protein